MSAWSLQCDVWLSRSSTPDAPSARMAFAAGWNARQELVEASNSAEETRPVGETNTQSEQFTCAMCVVESCDDLDKAVECTGKVL